jgi:hypothetical protein
VNSNGLGNQRIFDIITGTSVPLTDVGMSRIA